jgi:hypothetical protein
MRSQIGDPDPGEDEETSVVDDQKKILASGARRPADELITAGDLPGGCSPGEAGNGAGFDIGGIFKKRAYDLAISEIVVLGDETVMKGLLGATPDHF